MLRQKMAHKKTSSEAPGDDWSPQAHVEQPSREKRMWIRSRLHLVLAFVLMGVVIAAGAFLPARIAESFDRLLLSKVEVQTLAPDNETPLSTTSLIDRLKLLSTPYSELVTLSLRTGGRLDERTARETLDRELEDLRTRGLYPTADAFKETSKIEGYQTVSLYVMTGKPDISGIIWIIYLEGESFSGRFYLDDESGKVLSYLIQYEEQATDLFNEQSGERWMEYLGLATNGLQIVDETETLPSTYPEHMFDAPASSLYPDSAFIDSAPFGGTDSAEVLSFEKRLRFIMGTGSSPLEFYYERVTGETTTIVSLRVSSPKMEAASGISPEKLPETDAPVEIYSSGETDSSVDTTTSVEIS